MPITIHCTHQQIAPSMKLDLAATLTWQSWFSDKELDLRALVGRFASGIYL